MHLANLLSWLDLPCDFTGLNLRQLRILTHRFPEDGLKVTMRNRRIFGRAGILRKGSQHALPANAQLAKHTFVTGGVRSGA